jgi:diaminohydroxyphosphoribosylaminopyrimidine deaminase / 5-amino-6-(5-phosphoribosylamino)uracil reductase
VTDRDGMAQALALAVLGEGRTHPNPQVGCVLVRDGRVVGSGFHRAAGEPHAEAVALARAGTAARGATLYVNLEPCAHHGRTPPCADAIVAAGVARVVAGTRDPNPLVDGRGLDRLRSAGIAIETGLMEAECRSVNAGFLSVHGRGRPWITVKAAQSQDGLIAAAGGSSTWVTGEAARRYVHRLRYRHDAVLVGAATVRRDDPRLTVRLPGIDAARRRVVLATRFDVDPRAKVFARESAAAPRTRVYGGPDSRGGPLGEVAELVRVEATSDGLDLAAVLADLAGLGVQSVLVEGGGRTIGSFLRAGLVDEMALFVAPRLIGARGATPLVDLAAAASPDRAPRLIHRQMIPLGADVLLVAGVEAA